MGKQLARKASSRKPKKPKIRDHEKRKMTSYAIDQILSGASRLMLDAADISKDVDASNPLSDRALANRRRAQAARERVCNFLQDYLEFTPNRRHSPFVGAIRRIDCGPVGLCSIARGLCPASSAISPNDFRR